LYHTSNLSLIAIQIICCLLHAVTLLNRAKLINIYEAYTKDRTEILMGSPPTVALNAGRVNKTDDLHSLHRLSEMIHKWMYLLWSTNRKSHVVNYNSSTIWVILNYLKEFCFQTLVLSLSLTAWNSLPEYLRDPAIGRNSFRKQLKTFLFATY